MKQIIYMDGFDIVVDDDTQVTTIFSTKLPSDLAVLLGRNKMVDEVIDNVVNLFNKSNDLIEIDEYLLNEGLISQDEREIVIESLYLFAEESKNCHTQADNTNKKDEVEKILITMYSTLGIDRPSNHEDITQFVFEDICDTADPVNWNNDDVAIGFRRWIESQGEK